MVVWGQGHGQGQGKSGNEPNQTSRLELLWNMMQTLDADKTKLLEVTFQHIERQRWCFHFLTEELLETKGQRKGPEAERDDDENVWTLQNPGVWGVDSQWDQFTMASSSGQQ